MSKRSSLRPSAASPSFVLRQAQHEGRFFVASPNKINLILSLSKDEAAAPAAGNNKRHRRAISGSQSLPILHAREGRRDRGFTLIEVLVAFAILALTFTVLVRIFGGGLTAADRVARERGAILLARSRLAAVGVETPLALGTSDGEGAGGYRWHVAVEPDPNTAAQPSLPLLRRVNVTVSWAEGGRDRSVSLATLRLTPAPRP